MADEEQVRLGHQNLIDYIRATTNWASKGSIHQDSRVLLFAGGSWIPVIGNSAFCPDGTVPPADFIEQADAFFGNHKRGYSVKVRDTGQDAELLALCETHGLVAFGDPTPQMLCSQRLGASRPPDGISLRAVRDEQGVADFAAVNADAYGTYGMPAEVFDDLFDRPDRLLADANTTIVVAYQGSRPVATALTYLSGGVASLQWVGTIAEVRHMSLGRIVTEWATNVAFDMGATSVTLQASVMGGPLYTKLGYETLFHYQDYVRWQVPVT